MKIVVIGASGQLGSDIANHLNNKYDIIPLNHSDMSIENFDSSREILKKFSPDCIINTAAFHNVELCEVNPNDAFLINATAMKNLSIIANEINSILIQFSTNYVFGGENRLTPYTESDKTFPINMYGISKLAGEHIIQSYCNKWYIFRVAGLYGKTGTKAKKYKNFIDMMVKLSKNEKELPSSNDEFFTFTSTSDLAKMIEFILPKDAFGLYHATNSGECSRLTFSKEVFRLLDIECKLKGVSKNYFPTKYKQPNYTVLNNDKLTNLGFRMSDWKQSLKEYIQSAYDLDFQKK